MSMNYNIILPIISNSIARVIGSLKYVVVICAQLRRRRRVPMIIKLKSVTTLTCSITHPIVALTVFYDQKIEPSLPVNRVGLCFRISNLHSRRTRHKSKYCHQ